MVKKEIHIIGAGCAGLSLAKYLSIDSKTNTYKINFYGRKSNAFATPNYWSFWGDQVNLFVEQSIKKKWYEWEIISEESVVTHKTKNSPYCTINSREWLALCGFEKLVISPNIPEPGPLVFDSRNPRASSGGLTQEFVGQTIEVKKPLFNPKSVTLMDFRCDQRQGPHFIYILPFSSTSALIESTRISEFLCPSKYYKEAIKKYLTERLKCIEYRIIAEEYGKIPMGHVVKHDSNYLGIGSNGNCLRKSSGYAFNSIQHQTQQIAAQISAGQTITRQRQIPFAFSRLETILDSIFLMALKRQPHKAPEFFIKISKRLTGDEFTSFMSGKTRLNILLKIICALPKIPFLKAGFQTIQAKLYHGTDID